MQHPLEKTNAIWSSAIAGAIAAVSKACEEEHKRACESALQQSQAEWDSNPILTPDTVEVLGLREEACALRAETAKQAKSLADAKSTQDSLTRENVDLRTNHDSAIGEKAALEKELRSLQTTQTTTEAALSKASKEVTSLRAESDKATQANRAAERALQELQTKYMAAQEQLNSITAQQHKLQLSQKDGELASSKLEQSEAKLEEAKKTIAILRRDLETRPAETRSSAQIGKAGETETIEYLRAVLGGLYVIEDVSKKPHQMDILVTANADDVRIHIDCKNHKTHLLDVTELAAWHKNAEMLAQSPVTRKPTCAILFQRSSLRPTQKGNTRDGFETAHVGEWSHANLVSAILAHTVSFRREQKGKGEEEDKHLTHDELEETGQHLENLTEQLLKIYRSREKGRQAEQQIGASLLKELQALHDLHPSLVSEKSISSAHTTLNPTSKRKRVGEGHARLPAVRGTSGKVNGTGKDPEHKRAGSLAHSNVKTGVTAQPERKHAEKPERNHPEADDEEADVVPSPRRKRRVAVARPTVTSSKVDEWMAIAAQNFAKPTKR
jgi:hypothetical protein